MNEREIIECLHKQGVERPSELLCGIGDDCAVIEKNSEQSWLVTMDTLVETVHFDLRWHSPNKLGRKAVAVNVSDIAAMGGAPVFVFLSLGLPQGFDPAWMQEFSEGISGACIEYNCFLAGGDTVHSPEGVLITITVIGEVPTDQVVYRSGAMPGDTVWVSGTLGMAAAGLEICRKGIEPETATLMSMVEAHLNPKPRVHLGRLLAKSKITHSMMDLSDGLATDLSHLCQKSNVGALVRSDLLPVSTSFYDTARMLQKDPIDLMIRGGEDYELLFTAGPDSGLQMTSLANNAAVNITQVGTIVEQQGVRLAFAGSSLDEQKVMHIGFTGFDHFPDK